VATNVVVKTSIRVNGREYASVDEMPADARQAYERARESITSAQHGGPLGLLGKGAPGDAHRLLDAAIVFNGQGYASVDEMPAVARQLYEGVMAAMDTNRDGLSVQSKSATAATGQRQRGDAARSTPMSITIAGGIRPESAPLRFFIAGVLIGALVLAWFVLGR
jgi:hypothetical protein